MSSKEKQDVKRETADGEQLGFKGLDQGADISDAGFFFIIARKKENNEPFVLATYSREKGLESEFDLEEMIEDQHRKQIDEMIKEFETEKP